MNSFSKALEYLRGVFVRDAVLPVLTQVHVTRTTVAASNGRLLIVAPYTGLTIAGMERFDEHGLTVPGKELLRANDLLLTDPKRQVKLSINETGTRLTVQGGPQRVSLPVGDGKAFVYGEDNDEDTWASTDKRVLGLFLPALAALRPFVGDDASRPWSMGIRFSEQDALATNNVILARADSPLTAPKKRAAVSFTLPVQAADELLRIAETPTRLALHGTHALRITYAGGAYVRTLLLEGEWPPAGDMVRAAMTKSKLRKVDAEALLEAVDAVVPFCADSSVPTVFLDNEVVRTAEGDLCAKLQGFAFKGSYCFRAEPLKLVLRCAEQMDLDTFPRVTWAGSSITGKQEVPLTGLVLGIGEKE